MNSYGGPASGPELPRQSHKSPSISHQHREHQCYRIKLKLAMYLTIYPWTPTMIRSRLKVRVVVVVRPHRLLGGILTLAQEGILAAVEAITALKPSEALLTLYRCRRIMASRSW